MNMLAVSFHRVACQQSKLRKRVESEGRNQRELLARSWYCLSIIYISTWPRACVRVCVFFIGSVRPAS